MATKPINKNISRIKKFFGARGYVINVEPIRNRQMNELNYTVERNAWKDDKNYEHIIDCVFINPKWLPEARVHAVNIHPEFVICKKCGCSNNNACLGGCFWVEEDLCSSCAQQEDVEDKLKLRKQL